VQREHGAAHWRRGESGLRQENVAAALGYNQIMRLADERAIVGEPQSVNQAVATPFANSV
jgi:hypothetical protein